jgi:hypothetical protein
MDMNTYKKAKKLVSEVENLEKLLAWFADDPKNFSEICDLLNGETCLPVDEASKHVLRKAIRSCIGTKIKELEEL